jgi:hypothetical protein
MISHAAARGSRYGRVLRNRNATCCTQPPRGHVPGTVMLSKRALWWPQLLLNNLGYFKK